MNIHDPRYFNLDNLPNEQWKDIQGFEDEYEISSEGRVRSKERYVITKDNKIRSVRAKILKIHIVIDPKSNRFTCMVTLASGGRSKHHYCRSLLKLISDAFLLKDPDDSHLVCIDDPFDFCIDNLLYVTHKEYLELYDSN